MVLQESKIVLMSGIRLLFRISIVLSLLPNLLACQSASTTASDQLADDAVPYYNTPNFTPI